MRGRPAAIHIFLSILCRHPHQPHSSAFCAPPTVFGLRYSSVHAFMQERGFGGASHWPSGTRRQASTWCKHVIMAFLMQFKTA